MSKKNPLIHTPIASERGTLAQRLERAESQLQSIAETLPKLVAAGVLAASKKMYQELYSDIAAEHGRVFEVQEQAVMAMAESLHARLCVLESQAGIASPDLVSLRSLVEEIAAGPPDEEAQESRDEESCAAAVARLDAQLIKSAEAHGGGLSMSTFPKWNEPLDPSVQ